MIALPEAVVCAGTAVPTAVNTRTLREPSTWSTYTTRSASITTRFTVSPVAALMPSRCGRATARRRVSRCSSPLATSTSL